MGGKYPKNHPNSRKISVNPEKDLKITNFDIRKAEREEASASVVYFDQCLGAAHTKRWLKYVFGVALYSTIFKLAVVD